MNKYTKGLSINNLLLRYWPDFLQPGSLQRRFSKGLFWSFIGSVISQGSSLVATIVIARVLGKVGLGELGIILSTINTFSLFAGIGLGITVTKYVAEFQNNDKNRVSKIIGLSGIIVILSSLFMAIGLLIFAPTLAKNMLNAPHLANALRWSALLLWLNTVNSVQISGLMGFEAFKEIAKLNTIRAILTFPLTILGIWFFNVIGGIWASIVVSLIILILTQNSLEKIYKQYNLAIQYKIFRTELHLLWKFSLPVMISSIMVTPIMWIGNTLLINQRAGYSEMGIFNATNQWRTMLIFFPVVIGQVIIPTFSSLLGNNSKKQVEKILLSSIIFITLISSPIVIIILVFNEKIMSLFGPEFIGTGQVLIIMSSSAIILAILTPIGQLIISSGKAWLGTAMNAGWGFIFLACAWYFTSIQWGAKGLALSYLIAYAAHFLWTSSYAFYYFKGSKR